MKKTFLILLIIVNVIPATNFQLVCAQEQPTIDSLLNRLETATMDTSKVNLLNRLSNEYLNSSPEKAKDFAMQALHLAEKDGYRKGIAGSYSLIGTLNYYKSNYNEAYEYFRKSLKISEEIGDKKVISKCFNNIGTIYKDWGNYDKAIEYYQKSLKIDNELVDKKSISKCFNNIGVVHYYQGNYAKTIEYFQKSLKIKKELGYKRGIASSLNNIGVVYRTWGNYENAIEYYSKSLKIRKELGDKRGIASCLNNIGIVHDDWGNYDKAIENYQKSLKIKKELGDKSGISKCLNNIGLVHVNRGNYDEATEYCQMSLKINKELGDKSGISKCLNNIGLIYQDQSNYDKAREFYQKSLKIDKELDAKNGISKCLNNIGETYLVQEKYNIALTHFKKALKISREIGNKRTIAWSFNKFGELHLKQGHYSEALQQFEKALKLHKELGEEGRVVNDYISIGETCFGMNNYKKALHYYQKALMANLPDFNDSVVYHNPRELSTLSKPYLLETLNQKAKAFYLLYNKENTLKNIKASISTYELVFKLIYEMRNDYSHESTRLLLSENTKNYLVDAIQAAIEFNTLKPERKNAGKIFEYMEKSKSATLGAYLNDSKMKRNWNISDSLLEKEKDIVIKRRFYETKIQQSKAKNGGYDTVVVQGYQDKLFYYSRKYDNLVNALKNDYPDYYKLKYEQKVAGIEDIQNQLDKNSALINYFVADTSLFIACVNKEKVLYKVVKTDSLFNQKLIDYHIDVKSGFTKKDVENSTDLYQYLISPIEEYIKNKNNLIIISDGYLYYVPFETLCKNVTYTNDLSKIDYLVKNYSVSYHYSATLWLNSIEKTKKQLVKDENFIGFAPVFNTKTDNGYIFSREWISDTTKIEITTRSVSADLKHFNALPHSEEEIKAIVKLFGKKGKNAKGYFYHEANEENFKEQAQNYNYVHIASHSFANDYYPSLSGIAFSQPDTAKIGKEKDEDGILYAGETYHLDLSNANLIVLSSCKSGLGKLVQGEGFLSLSRGFLYSGTPNIIFSLWNVKDEQTKDLMIQFYKHVLKGKVYASALRRAKLKLISNPKTASPKYWAAWVLVGK